MPFNFANVIVLPMLLGMGIDNGVHLVHRHRTDPEEVDVLATSTARAIFSRRSPRSSASAAWPSPRTAAWRRSARC